MTVNPGQGRAVGIVGVQEIDQRPACAGMDPVDKTRHQLAAGGPACAIGDLPGQLASGMLPQRWSRQIGITVDSAGTTSSLKNRDANQTAARLLSRSNTRRSQMASNSSSIAPASASTAF